MKDTIKLPPWEEIGAGPMDLFTKVYDSLALESPDGRFRNPATRLLFPATLRGRKDAEEHLIRLVKSALDQIGFWNLSEAFERISLFLDRLPNTFPQTFGLLESEEGGSQKPRGNSRKNKQLTHSQAHDENLICYEKTAQQKPRPETPIGSRITKARQSLGLSQSQASARWGINVATLQQWEIGRRRPRALYAEKIESILAEIERDGKSPPGEAR